MEITLQCCEGSPEFEGQCLRNRCPHYQAAQEKMEGSWPRLETGFGNAFGNPKHGHFLARVRSNLGKSEEYMLKGFLKGRMSGRKNQTVTIPHCIMKLPCGCQRCWVEGAMGSTGSRPVDKEFRFKQKGHSRTWIHVECGKTLDI